MTDSTVSASSVAALPDSDVLLRAAADVFVYAVLTASCATRVAGNKGALSAAEILDALGNVTPATLLRRAQDLALTRIAAAVQDVCSMGSKG